ncbi:D-sedoheptulose-7-phosphate isomerase [Streptomyces marispadix]|uniref:SIS domain-containing protein n=1 Tax=Streptomyces marispadix TaxID=2922868 RepID=A0ABS9T587_9ACTN|nr:SIS domain-containing protein [Streptomyces marispadix]MCH6163675.1 SIS domain-containing protein [Streptomyces marispadix]
MAESPTAPPYETAGRQLTDHLETAERTRGLLPLLGTVAERLIEVFRSGGRLYTFGNGGSAADAQHLAAELIGRYLRERRPLPAVSLTTDPSVTSCIGNDYSFEELFARQVRALVRDGDMVIGFTTSGRSPNVVRGLAEAREAGAVTVLFCGGEQQGMPAAAHADHSLVVPSTTTARIQEMHLTLLHLLSEQADAWAADTEAPTRDSQGAHKSRELQEPPQTGTEPLETTA